MKLALRSSSPMSRWSLALLGVVLLMPATTRAADQMILGSKAQVQNSSTPDKQKISFAAKEKSSPNTLVGNPAVNGATLTIRLTGDAFDGETFNLNPGTSSSGKPFWTGDSVKGFKYADKLGDNGPVTSVQISAKNGTFAIKAQISGKHGTIQTLPPNPGADFCALLQINGGGDSYSVNLATGKASNKGAASFKIAKPLEEGSCARANPNNMPIQHVVLLMQENRSADTYLGQLSNQGQPDYEAEPNTGNPDPTNNSNPPIVPFHKTALCEVSDLDHSWAGTHSEVHNGLMDQFTKTNGVYLNAPMTDPTGSRSMGYYDQTDLPYYHSLYTTFATGDRYFCSVQTQTFPNRLYFLAGSSFGYIRNNVDALPYTVPNPHYPSIFNRMDQAGVTWRIYLAQVPSYAVVFFQYVADRAPVRVFPLSQYAIDLAAGTLPDVAYIDGIQFGTGENDEHPNANVTVGQKFVADQLNALMASPEWATSAFFLSYDEHGGFYDHVPPPAAVAPDNFPPDWAIGDPHKHFDEYGVRVPVVVVSPYSKPAFVSHVINDHTSQLAFLETRFGMPPLTARDAAANPMLEFFDFSTATFAVPPSLPAAVVTPCS